MTAEMIFFVALSLGFYCIILINLNKKHVNEKSKDTIINKPINVEKIKMLLSDNSIEKVDQFVDNIIRKHIDTYVILNCLDKYHYINTEESIIISKYILESMKNNMTETFKEVVGLYYDISTDKKLDDFLQLKIKIHLLAFIVENNQPIKD